MKPVPMPEHSKLLPICVIAAVVLLVASVWAWFSWGRVQSDLNTYAQAVRRATIPIYEKERLLDVIERLEDRVRNGERCPWLCWFRHDRTIREMLRKGIEGDEGRLIERELLRAEKEFTEQKP